jgi:hypothetical protein
MTKSNNQSLVITENETPDLKHGIQVKMQENEIARG